MTAQQSTPRTLSTGVPSTLGNWYALAKATFGEESKATLFLKEKMDAQGPDEEVVSDERQLLYALIQMARSDQESEERSGGSDSR